MRMATLRARNWNNSAGLTLIEVLVSLAIIAIALTAVIKATSQNIRSTNYLQKKTIALWVAQQAMSEVRVGLVKTSSESRNDSHWVNMLGMDMYWHAVQTTTPNKRIKKITINVYDKKDTGDEDSPVETLEGYLYDQNQ
jgi:general secretion pathway protein I